MSVFPLDDAPRVSTGVEGLDRVLEGGLIAYRAYLVQGAPGTGKTTLALQFLLDGHRRGEAVLYIALSETAEEIHATARSHGLALEGIEIFELATSQQHGLVGNEYTLFHPSEVELPETSKRLLEAIERTRPRRVVLDSLSELRLLAADPLRYRRQVLALKQFLSSRHCTVLLLDDRSEGEDALQLQSIAHGVLRLEMRILEYGAERRRLMVTKLRGSSFRGGYHDFSIERGGVVLYPRFIAAEHSDAADAPEEADASSGSVELDQLLGGGLRRGSSALFQGPSGTGKSVLCSLFIDAACARGEQVAAFTFDESARTLMERARSPSCRPTSTWRRSSGGW